MAPLRRTSFNFFSSDSTSHPSLSMARPMMYLFLLFIVMWNLKATTFLFTQVQPDFQDPASENFCQPTVYWFTYVLVCIFDLFFGSAFLVWLVAMLTGENSKFLYRFYGSLPRTVSSLVYPYEMLLKLIF